MGRYKGSILGLAWSLFNPVLMLVIYSFVFTVVFKSRWISGGEESKTQFAMLLFVGLILYNLFAEVLSSSPGLILSNVNYVKRVIFPLEILPVISMGVALFQAVASIVVLLIALVIFNGYLNWTAICLPLIMVPLIVFTLGLSWLLSSLGVFIRDMGQVINVFVTIMMFMSAVFYPISSLPKQYQPWLKANPLAFIIEQARQVLILGRMPDWTDLSFCLGIAIVVVWLGFAWFQKTRKGFADVL